MFFVTPQVFLLAQSQILIVTSPSQALQWWLPSSKMAINLHFLIKKPKAMRGLEAQQRSE